MPSRIVMIQTDDPRDAIHRAVACLAQGGCVGIALPGGYGALASALRPPAVERLGRCFPEESAAILVRGAAEVPDWVPGASGIALRLVSRSWPGPLATCWVGGLAGGLLARLDPAVGEAATSGGRGLHLACPSSETLRQIQALVPGPLILVQPLAEPDGPLGEPDRLDAIEALELVLDEGPCASSPRPALVRIEGERVEVLRAGVPDAAEITRRAGQQILFVCTGNTCRSPMAEALCRALLARRLGCEPEALGSRGFEVLSGGLAAVEGAPAAAHAIEVVEQRGGSLRGHASRRVTLELLEQADLIVTMTREHRRTILRYLPESAPRVRLLSAWDEDVEDPIGGDRETYRRAAQAIEEHIERLLDDLGA